MGAPYILGIIAALTCSVGSFCVLVFLLLLRKLGELQAEAEADNELFPSVPRSAPIIPLSRE